MDKNKHIYKVSELTQDIKIILESSFPEIWVEGEVSNFKRHHSGHIYFSLKDKAAQLKCVFFRNHNIKLKFELQDGQNIVCFGKIGVYAVNGEYQLYVQQVEPKGVGALALAFEQLKKKLEKEGLFDPKHKRPIPFLPRKIGIVTSKTGAAIQDILNILSRRFCDAEVIINSVKVQGEGAAEEISEAINDFNRFGQIDVMIVARGGGSPEDLWAFNEEIVARSIYNSKIPVISAVGHEIDFTIADFVADLRAPTPSAAAEIVLPRKEDLKEKLQILDERLNNYIENKFEFLTQELNSLITSYAFSLPMERVEQFQQQIDDLTNNLATHFKQAWRECELTANNLISQLENLSPLAVLARGYSIALKLPEEKVLSDANEVCVGDSVKIRLRTGSFNAKVATAEAQNDN